jgi:hypothetical protein
MSPPIPVIIGSTTVSTAAAVTAASMAFPPFCRTANAADVAIGWLVAATPRAAYTGDFPAIVGGRSTGRCGAFPAAPRCESADDSANPLQARAMTNERMVISSGRVGN